MDIDQKIEIIKEKLKKRSKDSIINDICNALDERNIEEASWTFDIDISEDAITGQEDSHNSKDINI